MCTKECLGFQELTYNTHSAEIMVDICVTCGQVIDLYTFATDREYIEYYKESIDDYVRLSHNWKQENNPAFVHCPKNRIAWNIKKLLGDEYNEGAFIIPEEDENEQAEQQAIIERMLKKYDLENIRAY